MRIREERADQVDRNNLMLQRSGDEQTWWTFGGTRVNATLAAALCEAGIESTANAEGVSMPVCEVAVIHRVRTYLDDHEVPISIDRQALDGLKFSVALPVDLAIQTLAERGSDSPRARLIASEPLLVCNES